MSKKLTTNQVHDRLHAARKAIGDDEAEKQFDNDALETIRRAITLLSVAVISKEND